MNYCINASWHGGHQPVALEENEAQLVLVTAFSLCVMSSLEFPVFLLSIPNRFWMEMFQVSLLTNSV